MSILTRKANDMFGRPGKGWNWCFKYFGESQEPSGIYVHYYVHRQKCHKSGFTETENQAVGAIMVPVSPGSEDDAP